MVALEWNQKEMLVTGGRVNFQSVADYDEPSMAKHTY